MNLPSAVASAWSFLQAQTAAAAPLAAAPHATVTAIKLNAGRLVDVVDTAIVDAAGSLDTWTAPADPDAIVAGVTSLALSGADQSDLVMLRGYAGRAAKNIAQLP